MQNIIKIQMPEERRHRVDSLDALYLEEYPVLKEIRKEFNYVYLALNRAAALSNNDEYYYMKILSDRATPGADFDSLDKAELREFLLKKQGYLCAYYMRKIRLQKDVKIEHYEARNDDNVLKISRFFLWSMLY